MSKTAPVYLLLGPEQGSKASFIKQIQRSLEEQSGASPEIHRFYPFETPVNNIISLLKNGSLFSQHKLVILSQVEIVKQKEEIEQLIDYCRQPSPEATLLLLSDSVTLSSKKITRDVKKAVGEENCKTFWELFENQKESWLYSFFNRKQITLKPDAMELFLDMVENNTREMRKEGEKLATFFGSGSVITAEDIETFIYHSKEENIFTLFNAIVERDFSLSLEIMQKLLLSGDNPPVQILGGLLWQFKKLHSLHYLLENHYGQAEAFAKLNMKSKRMQNNFITGRKNYSREKVEQILVDIAEYDGYIKHMQTDTQPLLMSLFLYYCVAT
jgi:DNA polymerase-3 subunit delta